jgi:hypothetical protein
MRKTTITTLALTACVVSTGPAALAMTQDEAIAAIRQQVSNGGGGPTSGAYAWMAAVALALSLILLLMRWRRGERNRKPALNDPAKLIREVRREAGLTRADVRRLRRETADVQRKTGTTVGNPLVLVLCPSLTQRK